MDGDIGQVTLTVLGFLIALGLLIFTMDWLEDSIDAPPSRFRQRLFGLVRRWTGHAPGDGQTWRPLAEEAAPTEALRIPRQRESVENDVLPPPADVPADEPGDVGQQTPKAAPQ